jgi:transglutaminase-like putative cysteine protease
MSDRDWIRLAVFGLLAAFAAAHWVGLVADPPVARTALAVAILLGAAAILVLIGRSQVSGPPAWALAAVVSVAATLAALVVIGLPARLLFPGNWDELGDDIHRGTLGIGEHVEYPYAGANDWSRLVLLLGLPALLGIAVALAFWPTRRADLTRTLGLVGVVGIYVVAVAAYPRDGQILRGLVLLVLIAAWLWLPGLGRRAIAAAAGVVVAAGVVSIPVAAALDADDPWIDYNDWTFSGVQGTVEFQWNQTYGPLDWPRDGTPLLEIASDQPHYWRAIVLDRFDGYRWQRSEGIVSKPLELPYQVERGPNAPPTAAKANAKWIDRVDVTVRGLGGEFVVGPGTVRAVDGIDDATTSGDGTTLVGQPLTEGDGYTVTGYEPDPGVSRMRNAPARYAPSLRRYTTLELPRPALNSRSSRATILNQPPFVRVPLRGHPQEKAAAILEDSRYRRVYRLAQRLGAGEPTAYDAAIAIENRLQSRYSYSERVPAHQLALRAFLFNDREGYCQQFSGAMALMLRMLGIPSRVASGFAPGTPEGDGYLVRDTDAHSWVEIYFTGIGWVPFDPTPPSAPAALQASELGAAGLGVDQATTAESSAAEQQNRVRAVDPALPTTPPSSNVAPAWTVPVALAILLAALAAMLVVRRLRYRSLPPDAAARAQVAEVAAALPKLGYPLPGGITLLRLEQRLGGDRRATRTYLAKLRRGRYDQGRALAPTLSERARMRRELCRGRGVSGRVRGLFAMPPGGPRR